MSRKNQYTAKPVNIEAFQITQGRMEDRSAWPEWLTKAFEKGMAPFGAWKSGESLFMIATNDGATPIYEGDWVIENADGSLSVKGPKQFKREYEKKTDDPVMSFKDLGIKDRLDALLTGLGVEPEMIEKAPAHIYQSIGQKLTKQAADHVRSTTRMAFLGKHTVVENLGDCNFRFKLSVRCINDNDEVPPVFTDVLDHLINKTKEEIGPASGHGLKLLK